MGRASYGGPLRGGSEWPDGVPPERRRHPHQGRARPPGHRLRRSRHRVPPVGARHPAGAGGRRRGRGDGPGDERRVGRSAGCRPSRCAPPGSSARRGGVCPTRNTLDRGTALLPDLLAARLPELGIDHAVLYPTYGLVPAALDDAAIRLPDGARVQHLLRGGVPRPRRRRSRPSASSRCTRPRRRSPSSTTRPVSSG